MQGLNTVDLEVFERVSSQGLLNFPLLIQMAKATTQIDPQLVGFILEKAAPANKYEKLLAAIPASLVRAALDEVPTSQQLYLLHDTPLARRIINQTSAIRATAYYVSIIEELLLNDPNWPILKDEHFGWTTKELRSRIADPLRVNTYHKASLVAKLFMLQSHRVRVQILKKARALTLAFDWETQNGFTEIMPLFHFMLVLHIDAEDKPNDSLDAFVPFPILPLLKAAASCGVTHTLALCSLANTQVIRDFMLDNFVEVVKEMNFTRSRASILRMQIHAAIARDEAGKPGSQTDAWDRLRKTETDLAAIYNWTQKGAAAFKMTVLKALTIKSLLETESEEIFDSPDLLTIALQHGSNSTRRKLYAMNATACLKRDSRSSRGLTTIPYIL